MFLKYTNPKFQKTYLISCF